MSDQSLAAHEPSDQVPDRSEHSSELQLGLADNVHIGGDVVGRDRVTNTSAGGDVVGRDKITQILNINVARDGLGALGELLRTPSVRTNFVVIRADFEEVRVQIEILGDYKLLHDLLHQLEFECYAVLKDAATHFPNDPGALSALDQYQIILDRIIEQMQFVAARQIVSQQDVIWIQRLGSLPEELERAISQPDTKQLEAISIRLKVLLQVQPSHINQRLNATARTLRLAALVKSLSSTQETMFQDPTLDEAKVQLFRSGVSELVRVSQTLNQLIELHDGWQAVQTMLNRLADQYLLGFGFQELTVSLPDLKAMVEPLCARQSDRMTQNFIRIGTQLEIDVAAANIASISRSFLKYQALAAQLFYRIDVDLRQLCEELRKAGEPMAIILSVLA